MFTVTYSYRHDSAKVMALLVDPDYLKERCEAMGERNVTAQVSTQGTKTVVTTARDVQRELPGFAAKIFKPKNHVHQVEEWIDDGGPVKRGSYTLDIGGAPITMRAEFTLAPQNTGSLYTIHYEIKAHVPLIGRKLENFMFEQTKTSSAKEMDYNARTLAARG